MPPTPDKTQPPAPPADALPADPSQAPAAQTPAPKAEAAVPAGAVRVKAHANLSLGGVILTVDQVGLVPDDAETRACLAAELLSIED